MKKVKVKKSVRAHLAHTGQFLPTVAALVAPLQNKIITLLIFKLLFPLQSARVIFLAEKPFDGRTALL